MPGQLSEGAKSRHGAVMREMAAKAERSVASAVVQQLLEGVVEDAQAWGHNNGAGAELHSDDYDSASQAGSASWGSEQGASGGGQQGVREIFPGFRKQKVAREAGGQGKGQDGVARRRRRRTVLDRQKAVVDA